jgi:hypothetical protein
VNIDRPIFADLRATDLAFDPLRFFDGRVVSHGFIIDFGGKVRRSFTINFIGTLRDGALNVDEELFFNDGEIAARVWKFAPRGDGTWTASANDIPGPIDIRRGALAGESRWTYRMALPIGGRPMTFDFEDVMVMTAADCMTAVTHVRKLGFKVARIVSTYQRMAA